MNYLHYMTQFSLYQEYKYVPSHLCVDYVYRKMFLWLYVVPVVLGDSFIGTVYTGDSRNNS